MSQAGLAGVIEFFGGLFLVIGFMTRITAVIAGLEMLWAYFTVHIPNSFFPIMNKGEPALLFFAIFLLLAVHGAKKWGVDTALRS